MRITVSLLIVVVAITFAVVVPVWQRKASVPVTAPAESEKCEAPKQNLESFGNEIRQLIIRHNEPTSYGGLADEGAAREAQGLLDYAERCWQGFTFEGAGITEEDLKTVGYLPRGRRP